MQRAPVEARLARRLRRLLPGAGFAYACAVRAGGSVWCWGSGGNGQLGNNATADSPIAVQVVTTAGPPLTGIVAVAGGSYFACALASDATVWCWGDNGQGQLG